MITNTTSLIKKEVMETISKLKPNLRLGYRKYLESKDVKIFVRASKDYSGESIYPGKTRNWYGNPAEYVKEYKREKKKAYILFTTGTTDTWLP